MIHRNNGLRIARGDFLALADSIVNNLQAIGQTELLGTVADPSNSGRGRKSSAAPIEDLVEHVYFASTRLSGIT